MINLIKRMFSKNTEQILSDDYFDDDDKEDELNFILNQHDKNIEEVQKWDSNNLLARLTLEKEQKLYNIRFCFIPKSQNFKNVRSYIEYNYGSYEKWQTLRKYFIKKYNYTCQCCSLQTKDLELHEHWNFNDFDRRQILSSLILLCEQCHSIAHITMSKKEPTKFNKLLNLYSKYNKIDLDKTYKDLEFHEQLREKRNSINYQLDLSYLNEFDDFDIKQLFNCHSDNFNGFIHTFSEKNKNDK